MCPAVTVEGVLFRWPLLSASMLLLTPDLFFFYFVTCEKRLKRVKKKKGLVLYMHTYVKLNSVKYSHEL